MRRKDYLVKASVQFVVGGIDEITAREVKRFALRALSKWLPETATAKSWIVLS